MSLFSSFISSLTHTAHLKNRAYTIADHIADDWNPTNAT